jgi:hypothetical protein
MIHGSGKAAMCGSEMRKGEFILTSSAAVMAPCSSPFAHIILYLKDMKAFTLHSSSTSANHNSHNNKTHNSHIYL